MKPLLTTRVVLTWIWMCSEDDISSKWKKFGHYVFGRFCLIFQILSFVGATACFVKFLPIDISKVLFESMFVSGHFNATYSIIHGMRSRNEIARLFTRLSKIYRNCMYFVWYHTILENRQVSDGMKIFFFIYHFFFSYGY